MLDPARATTWPLRLGHTWSGLGPYTTPLLRAWREAHPDIPLQLLRLDERTAGLAQGKVDAAVVRQPIDLPDIHVIRLFSETRMAAAPADHPLARRSSLSLADLAAYPVALNTISGTTTVDLWPEGGRPRSTVEVANTDDWSAAIGAGLTVGVTTTATARMHPHVAVAYLPLTGASDVEVLLAWRHPPTHPAVTKLPDLIAGVVAAHPDGTDVT